MVSAGGDGRADICGNDMDKTTLWLSGSIFVMVFAGVIAGPAIMDATNRPHLQRLSTRVDDKFERYVPPAGQTEAERVAGAKASRALQDKLMAQMRNGTVPDELISEGADDAPGQEGDVFYASFSPQTGPFRGKTSGGNSVDCFAARVGGKTQHIVIKTQGGTVETHDPDNLNGWVFSNCSDGLKIGAHRLSPAKYLKTRIALLPDTLAYQPQKAALQARLKTVKPDLW